jgi:hypothetical protein
VSHPFVFRPDTHDEEVFHAINLHNEYRLPEQFQADVVIIDIGMHIGSFWYAAMVRGSNRVYGFEASPENFARAKANRMVVGHPEAWRHDPCAGPIEMGKVAAQSALHGRIGMPE